MFSNYYHDWFFLRFKVFFLPLTLERKGIFSNSKAEHNSHVTEYLPPKLLSSLPCLAEGGSK